MALSLTDLRSQVQMRLGDGGAAVWTEDEIDQYLRDGYAEIAEGCRVFWDWWYAENLPRGFSCTQPWEQAMLAERGEAFDYGVANCTAEFERLIDQEERIGPGNHTSPFEAIDGHLSDAGADTSIPATSEAPETLTEMSRGVWDQRGIEGLVTRQMRQLDSRYRETAGEVYGLLWEFDGVRTIRKVRKPSAQAECEDIEDAWGAMRDPEDLSTDTVTGELEEYAAFSFTAEWEQPYAIDHDLGWASHTADFEAAWVDDVQSAANHTSLFEAELLDRAGAQMFWERFRGVPRRIAGQHPIGPYRFGLPRRPYCDGTNVRVEHWRQGSQMETWNDDCELPDRYALYLRDYAQARCLGRAGPGHDLRLSAHFQERWARGVARILARMAAVVSERVMVMGGSSGPLTPRPPRPSLPWPYPAVQVR